MILHILDKNYDKILLTLLIVSIAWLAVGLAIGVDLIFGVKKAKSLGECTTSEGFRRTVNKATYYYALMTFGVIFDVFDVVTPIFIPNKIATIPFFTIIVALGLVLNEAKSVREKAEDKVRRRSDQTFREVIKLINERQGLMDNLLTHLKDEKNKTKNT